MRERDPARIESMLGVLRNYWLAHPDLRLGQIVGNMSTGTDSYYIEDDELETRLRATISRDKKLIGRRGPPSLQRNE